MANDPILLTQVDMRLAETAGDTRSLIIDKLTIPAIKFKTAGSSTGVMDINWSLNRVEAIEPKLTIKGLDVDTYDWLGETRRFVFAQGFRNKRKNKAVGARASIEGVLVEMAQDEGGGDEFTGTSLSFEEVTHFEYHFDGKELWYIDFWENVIRKNGKELFAEERRALGA